jgi:hypothetical protein
MPIIIATEPRFPLGQIVATRGAHEALSPAELAEAIRRHASGDWGEVCPEDAEENELSVREGFRILSAYTFREVKVWVITESDRSATTVLLPEEY